MPVVRSRCRQHHVPPRRRGLWLASHLALLACLLAPLARADEAPLTPDAAVAAALQNSPALDQLEARYHALAEVPSQVGTLPDPTVEIAAVNFPTDSFRRRQEPMTQIRFGVAQRFPFPGKLALAERVADHLAGAAGWEFEEAKLTLERDVRRTWWEIAYLDRALGIVAQNQVLLRQFVDIASAKYRVGEGLQQDVLLAQVELSRLFDRELALQRERGVAAARLNRLLDRDPALPVVLKADQAPELPDLPPLQVHLDRAKLQRPLLAAIAERLEAATARLDLARRDYFPDFTVGAAYGLRTGSNPLPRGGDRADLLTLRLGMNLPIHQRRKLARAVSQRASERDATDFEQRAALDAVFEEIQAARQRYLAARDQITLFATGIIPQSRQTVESMLAGYRTSRVDFLNLVRSQVRLLDHEVQLSLVQTRSQQALADLRAALAGETHE